MQIKRNLYHCVTIQTLLLFFYPLYYKNYSSILRLRQPILKTVRKLAFLVLQNMCSALPCMEGLITMQNCLITLPSSTKQASWLVEEEEQT